MCLRHTLAKASPTFLDPESAQKLSEAEVVLGVVGAGLTEACRQELDKGTALRKNMIVMSYPVFAQQLQPYFGANVVVIDPVKPDEAEIGIVEHLKTIDAQQSAKKACWLWSRLRLAY
jgi:hypothetical protein